MSAKRILVIGFIFVLILSGCGSNVKDNVSDEMSQMSFSAPAEEDYLDIISRAEVSEAEKKFDKEIVDKYICPDKYENYEYSITLDQMYDKTTDGSFVNATTQTKLLINGRSDDIYHFQIIDYRLDFDRADLQTFRIEDGKITLMNNPGMKQRYEVKGDTIEMGFWNDLVETGYYMTFIWKENVGLVKFRSGYGAGRDSIEIELIQ